LLRLDSCSCQWQPVWPPHCNPLAEADITAIAVSGDQIAVADRASGSIALVDGGGARVVARIPCSAVLAMAFGSAGSLLVAAGSVPRLLRFDRAGRVL